SRTTPRRPCPQARRHSGSSPASTRSASPTSTRPATPPARESRKISSTSFARRWRAGERHGCPLRGFTAVRARRSFVRHRRRRGRSCGIARDGRDRKRLGDTPAAAAGKGLPGPLGGGAIEERFAALRLSLAPELRALAERAMIARRNASRAVPEGAGAEVRAPIDSLTAAALDLAARAAEVSRASAPEAEEHLRQR